MRPQQATFSGIEREAKRVELGGETLERWLEIREFPHHREVVVHPNTRKARARDRLAVHSTAHGRVDRLVDRLDGGVKQDGR